MPCSTEEKTTLVNPHLPLSVPRTSKLVASNWMAPFSHEDKGINSQNHHKLKTIHGRFKGLENFQKCVTKAILVASKFLIR